MLERRFRILFLLNICIFIKAETAPCDISNRKSVIVLDVIESIGDEFTQPIQPSELPIAGTPGEDITLELAGGGLEGFALTGKTLRLTKPLDRDEANLSILRFEIRCISRSSGLETRSIPVVLRIQDINDNRPEFKGAPYLIAVKEDAPVNSPIFNGIRAKDRDSGTNGQVEYEIIDISPAGNRSNPIFNIRFPHQGAVFLMAPLNYETTPLYQVTVLATDHSENLEERLNSTTTLTIRVLDVDDQDPVFDSAAVPSTCLQDSTCLPEYHSSVVEGAVAGILDVYPGRIHAKDLDTIGAPIIYSFRSGTPTSYEEYFEIDPRSGSVTQIKEVDRTRIKVFDIIIQAVEKTPRKGRTASRLKINVQKVDKSPPKLMIPAYTGEVPEGSAPGTPVLRDDGSGAPFMLSVFDPDLEIGDEALSYVYELTTTAFEVNENGVLVVATPNLDRDPPNRPHHTFQVIARENREHGSASAPVKLTVHLLDINDNAPRLPLLPTVTVSAGSLRRKVIEVRAEDIDEGENARVRYQLLNGGRGKFNIDRNTGSVTAVGDLEAGEKFFLNIKATDTGGLSTEGFVEVVVSRGPNTNGPIFTRSQYSTTVREDIAHGEQILTVQASDPEDDVSYYSITKGNEDKAFEMDTLTGILTVVAPLDREKTSEHVLTITAEDSEGKANTADVIIRVSDVNDETPSFVGEPYSFRVDEGVTNASVGVVKAEDKDLGLFGQVFYLLEDDSSQFKIDTKSGEIFTNYSLDYEKDQVHFVSVVAHDSANDPRSATTTVTILVNDLQDEKPFFPDKLYKVQVLENAAIGSVVTTVRAKDKDTEPEITYKMVEGDSSLFRVATDTGRVTVAGGLDFEVKANHSIVIGTEENPGRSLGDETTLVVVELEDVNDAMPIIDPIHTVTLAKEAPLDTLVTNVSATDADGTSPNKKIKFNLVEDPDVTSYFEIDPNKGEIRLKRILSNVDFTERTIKVTATDGGDPPLSSSKEFQILLLEGVLGNPFGGASQGTHLTSSNGGHLSSLVSSPRFSKEKFELKVNENLAVGSVVVKVPLANTTTSSITCTIVEGNEQGYFRTLVTDDGNCKVISAKILDFEEKSSYNLSLALLPEGFASSDDQDVPILSKAFIRISLQDLNDNSPSFMLKDVDVLENYAQTTVLSYVLQNSPIGTKIIELMAHDLDSDKQGAIEYKLLPETNRGNYFNVDPKLGRIYTKREIQNIPLELIPFNLSLLARDKPGINGTQHSTVINVIVPVVEESHQAIVIFDSPRDDVNAQLTMLRKRMSEITGKMVQIEKLRQVRKNSKAETQMWFHLLEHGSWDPVKPEHLFVEEEKGKMVLVDIKKSVPTLHPMHLISPAMLKQQMAEPSDQLDSLKEAENRGDERVLLVNTALVGLTPLEYALIALAAVIILFVLIAMLTVCILWSRFSKKWNSADKTVMLIPPMIERPSSVLESISKEYEVQVLHMSVPMDDESVQESPGESDSPRQPYLDNVSYISKSLNGVEGSCSEESSGMATPNAIGISHGGVEAYPTWSPDTPMRTDHFSSTRLDADPNSMSASISNENVMFARRGFGDPSPVETTTEL